MSRILIATMHRGDNYGSALQVYALSEKLKTMGGHEPIVLDYIPRRINLRKQIQGLLKQLFFSKSIVERKNAVRGLAITITNYHCYNRFFKRELSLTSKYNSLLEIEKAHLQADVYMTGSDQVWNSIHNHGIDPVFFLKFAPYRCRKISYSASFGKEYLDDWEKKETKELLARYDAISVRELSGKNIVNALGLPCEVVLDPTFLLTKNEWQKRCIPHLENDKYVLIYSVEPDKQSVINVAKQIADKLQAKVFMVEWGHKPYPGVDKMVSLVDPLMLIDYFVKAEFVVASSFHGTALSLNLGKPFISLAPARFNSRVKSILQIVGLSDRLVSSSEFDLSKALKNIDYQEVEKRLSEERKKSVDFLRTNLEVNETNL